MFTISKSFTFEAAHFLKGLPEGHQCGSMHGHSYQVIVILRGKDLNQHGFLFDYNDLKFVKNFLDTTFDHKVLNEALPLQPTAENIARFLFFWLQDYFDQAGWNRHLVYAVRVKETEKTEAEYSPYVG
jgi:6-pyruvoyltetrahydropterin/6-carboxytetrahydropterin synthase